MAPVHEHVRTTLKLLCRDTPDFVIAPTSVRIKQLQEFLKSDHWLRRYCILSRGVTSSAVALHCCKAHSKINRKVGNSTPCKIVTPKISTWNFAYVITSGRLPTMQILVLIGIVGASPHIGELLPLCDFFFWLSCPVLSCPFFLRNAPRPNRWTDFHALWLKRRVSA